MLCEVYRNQEMHIDVILGSEFVSIGFMAIQLK